MNHKIIIFFCLVLASRFSFAQTRLIGPIIPIAPTATFPTHYDSLGRGGYMSFSTLDSRNNLPVERRKVGMLAYVEETNFVYILNTDLTTWSTFVKGSLGFPGQNAITSLPIIGANLATNDFKDWLSRAFFSGIPELFFYEISAPSLNLPATPLVNNPDRNASSIDVERAAPGSSQTIILEASLGVTPSVEPTTISSTVYHLGYTNGSTFTDVATPLNVDQTTVNGGPVSIPFNYNANFDQYLAEIRIVNTTSDGRIYTQKVPLNFKSRLYYGFIDDPGTTPVLTPNYFNLQQGLISGLSGQLLGTTREFSKFSGISSSPSPLSQRFVIAYPLAFDNVNGSGIADIQIGGKSTDFYRYQLTGFNTINGATIDYVVYVAKSGFEFRF